ncbi:hypothetical protein DsansV1_C04g0039831 [Dioscorea sansibarensis]
MNASEAIDNQFHGFQAQGTVKISACSTTFSFLLGTICMKSFFFPYFVTDSGLFFCSCYPFKLQSL